jgi:hypothetical protein
MFLLPRIDNVIIVPKLVFLYNSFQSTLWRKNINTSLRNIINVRYYRIANITIQVESDMPFTDTTFRSQLELFRVEGPGEDTVTIHHHFHLPDIDMQNLGKEVYRKAPWSIFKNGDDWIYLGVLPAGSTQSFWKIAKFNHDHSRAEIYSYSSEAWIHGNQQSLSTLPTDQIYIGKLLAERRGFYIHSAGVVVNGGGLLFVGHSEAGKSTTTQMFLNAQANLSEEKSLQVEILCDDRNIIRYGKEGWHVYGTWSNGDIPNVSPSSAPLRAIYFLEQAKENALIPLTDHQDIYRRVWACLIKPYVSTEWWEKTLDMIEKLVNEVPCFVMRFTKNGEIINKIVRNLSETDYGRF